MFIEFILWLILFYLLFRVMVRFLFPILAQWYVKRFQKKFYEQNPHLKDDKKKNANKVRIKRPDSSRRMNTDRMGEYVDYEEVE